MSDPTAAEAVAQALAFMESCGTDDTYDELDRSVAAALVEALGIDPDSPLSLLHWHATQTERERCARIAETAGRANSQWIADQIRRSDRL